MIRSHDQPIAAPRVALLGGAGYIGSACFRAFRSRGLEVFAVDDLSEGNRAAVGPPERLFVHDILDTDGLARIFRSCGITAVMHFAALASVPDSLRRPADYWRVNAMGTLSVLAAMRQAGVPRLVFSSTAAVYRHGLDRPIGEEDPTDPATPYGSSKRAAEWLIRDFALAHGLTAVGFRYFNGCGADEDGRHGEARRRETHVVPCLLAAALGDAPCFTLYGSDLPTRDGSCVRDFVSIQDLAEAHWLGLTGPMAAPFAVFNLGSGVGVTVLELLAAARRITGRPIPVRSAPPRPGDPPVLVADIGKARQQLGWRPRRSAPDQFLRTAWLWHRQHRQGYGTVNDQEGAAHA